MSAYPLYDVPYLVREPNDFRMSAKRHHIEVRNQAVVDDYFVARDKGASAREARKRVADKHHMTYLAKMGYEKYDGIYKKNL